MVGLIVAYAKNRVFGKNGKMPWYIKGEQRRFKRLTTGNVIIMGRKTFEDMGKPLPDRLNIILSTTKNFDCENCITCKSLAEALELCNGRDSFICGGERLFKEGLALADKLYITKIEADFEGDVYFPEFDETQFEVIVEERVEGEIPYEYLTYTRKVKPDNNLTKICCE